MRTKIGTSLGALLLFLAPLGCSDPDAPSPEQPPAGPEFIDVTESMEENIDEEILGCYYNYFRFQNASDHTVYIGYATIYGWESTVLYIRPGEQATTWLMMERLPGIGLVDVLITDLTMMGFIQFWVNAPAPGEFPPLGGGGETGATTLAGRRPRYDGAVFVLRRTGIRQSPCHSERPCTMDVRTAFRLPGALDLSHHQRRP